MCEGDSFCLHDVQANVEIVLPRVGFVDPRDGDVFALLHLQSHAEHFEV